MTAQIDLHELANSHGFGKAQDIIKAAGFWNEKNAPRGDGKKPFTVTVECAATITVTTEIEVFADTEDEAKTTAVQTIRRTGGDDWDGDRLDFEVDESTAEAVEVIESSDE